jgi:SNF2 family DNA or RNA helicase
MAALHKFKTEARCHLLLLSVGACASGLTLTHANHCILLDLQAHEGKELQLINRVWRIGQERPVTIKRLVAAGTIEERMLHLRKRSQGLMADDDADTLAAASLKDDSALTSDAAKKAKGKAAAAQAGVHTEREDDLRYLYGIGAEDVADID